MAKTAGFENLQVYQLSEKLSDCVWGVVQKWKSVARKTVGNQLVRAADSIGANIARGSLNETRHWLRRAHRRNLLSSEDTTALKTILDELAPRLNAYLNSIGQTNDK